MTTTQRTLTLSVMGTYALSEAGRVIRVGIPHTTATQMVEEGSAVFA